MQQAERGGGGGGGPEDIKQQHQDRRLKPMQAENQQQAQQQPQKCPRCESLNTKFCYYNNYSLSQPRFFCKTCRRYWTQGGTLRNVPVGGGCRKGKRAKTSSSSSTEINSRPSQQNPSNPVIATTSQALRTKEPAANLASPSAAPIPSITAPYYQGSGFLSSLAAIQSLNQSQSSFSQALHVGADLGGSSNLGVLQGYSVPTFASQQQQQQRQIHQQTQFYQMGSRDRSIEQPFYPNEETMNYSRRPTTHSSHHDWPQSFISNTNPRASDHATLWRNTETNNNAASSLNPNQWPGYGRPPP